MLLNASSETNYEYIRQKCVDKRTIYSAYAPVIIPKWFGKQVMGLWSILCWTLSLLSIPMVKRILIQVMTVPRVDIDSFVFVAARLSNPGIIPLI